jgi:hypothetical protein
MSEEQETPEPDFAAFEEQATAPEPVEEKKDDPVEELENFDAPEEETPEAREKRRSKPLHQRLGETTEKWRNAEAKAAELEKRLAALEAGREAPKEAVAPEEPTPPDPNDDKYEFGEADPKYLADLTEFKVDQRLRAKDKETADKAEEAKRAETSAAAGRELDGKWAEQTKIGTEKYDDFSTVVDDFTKNAPCPPLMAAAISDSPVGADVTYHLGKNQPTAHLLAAKLASGDVIGAAADFGEIEGQFMDKAPDGPATNHPLDIAIYAGRMRGFMAKPKGKLATDAPEPPKHLARGGSGRFEVGGDTTDFAAFEKAANRSGRS